MASEETSLVSAQRLDNGINPQLVFRDDNLRFSSGPPQRCVVGDPGPKTSQELPGFIHHHYFRPQTAGFSRAMFPDSAPGHHSWNGNGRTSTTPSGEGSAGDQDDDDDEDDDEDEDDEVDETENQIDGLVLDNNNDSNGNCCNNGKIVDGKARPLASFGNGVQSENDNNDVRVSSSENHRRGRDDTEGDLYFPRFMQGPEASAARQKDMVVENGCSFSGRKDTSHSSEPAESLRAILSDPLTGALMDDAMILPCGHSFGSSGIQHVIRMKVCHTCSQAVSEDSVVPNISLRAAVQAFRQEEELHVNRASKRRKERHEQDKGSYNDSMVMDHKRGRGIQFPFSVSDRVIIKGNKRTPLRFVGREAVVTTQCLNGWYVVKTLDNAESVKLQYRSLAKVSDGQFKSNVN